MSTRETNGPGNMTVAGGAAAPRAPARKRYTSFVYTTVGDDGGGNGGSEASGNVINSNEGFSHDLIDLSDPLENESFSASSHFHHNNFSSSSGHVKAKDALSTLEIQCNEDEMSFDRRIYESRGPSQSRADVMTNSAEFPPPPPPEELEISEITDRMEREQRFAQSSFNASSSSSSSSSYAMVGQQRLLADSTNIKEHRLTYLHPEQFEVGRSQNRIMQTESDDAGFACITVETNNNNNNNSNNSNNNNNNNNNNNSKRRRVQRRQLRRRWV